MKANCRIQLALVLGIAAMQGACGSDDPTRVGRPPVVKSFTPSTRALTVYVGDVVDFRLSAFDPDLDPLSTTYTVDGVVAGTGERFQYNVDDVGSVTIRASVGDGQYVSYIEWTLTRKIPSNFPPSFTATLPVESEPRLVIGNDMNFGVQAADPEGAPITYRFTVDDVVVADAQQFVYHATTTGYQDIEAFASDGVHTISRAWRLKVTEVPDGIPPAPIDIVLAETGGDPGEIDLEWIAVGEDDMTGTASQYRVRTLPTPILTEQDWGRASERPGVPPPVAAGQPMSMTLTGLQPARMTYIAIRAEDDFGNQSPLLESPSATTRGLTISGVVLDALTNQPISDATVSFGSNSSVTDINGGWTLRELGVGTSSLVTRDEPNVGVGAYYDYTLQYTVVHGDMVELYLLPDLALETTEYADFLTWFRIMTDTSGNPYGTETRRWELPITLYVRAFSKGGLDYGATIERIAIEFRYLLGEDMFTIVYDGLADGVETVYLDNIAHDNYRTQEWTDDWYPHLGMIQFRTVYDPGNEDWFAKVVRHEIGHALGLNHSIDSRHLMVAGIVPQVDTFSNDEIAVIQCRYRLPRGWDTRGYDRE
jgi:Matrixin